MSFPVSRWMSLRNSFQPLRWLPCVPRSADRTADTSVGPSAPRPDDPTTEKGTRPAWDGSLRPGPYLSSRTRTRTCARLAPLWPAAGNGKAPGRRWGT
ncbi:hypothetical protein GCM10010521_63050 [Streptomyces rameus]|uniref:Secreted protein n=1 Tax=Streptomyces rameus TaxID=68261 RepID=A0ABN3V6A7_9ACTN